MWLPENVVPKHTDHVHGHHPGSLQKHGHDTKQSHHLGLAAQDMHEKVIGIQNVTESFTLF